MNIKNIRVLVTGGSGFIGTNLIDYYLLSGTNVTLANIDRIEPKLKSHYRYWLNVDICNANVLKKAILEYDPHYIIHLAARTDLNEREDIEGYSANTVGVQNIVDAIKNLSSLKRVIFTSSRLVCKIGYNPKDDFEYCPSTLYGESKVITEKIVRENSKVIPCSWVIVRPSTIWGPWFGSPFREFFIHISNGMYFHPGKKDPIKHFGYVGNTTFQLDRILKAPEELICGRTFYLCDYIPIRLRAWADRIKEILGGQRLRTLPLSVLNITGWTGDLLHFMGWKSFPFTSFRFNNIITDMTFDVYEIEKIVGPLPYSIDEGIIKTVEWMKAHSNI